MQLEPNILFHNRYRLIEMKGRGSFGEVWRARDEHLNIEVAIKVYVALDDNGCEEFGREYLRVRSLLHPNLLRAEHYDLYGDRPFLVMEYCPSGAKDLIGRADEITLLHFIRDVASGLAYMHERDMLHRDIKPDNILRKADGTFVITDFGLSKNMHSTLRRNSSRNLSTESVNDMLSGTVEYMAPELFTSDPVAVKATDVWALGVTLYEIIMGELPFFGKGGNMMNFGAAVPNIHAPLSENLIETVRGCMAKDPWDRPTAQALADWAKGGIEFYNEVGYFPQVTSSNYSSPDISVAPNPSDTIPDSDKEEHPVSSVDRPPRRLWAAIAAVLVLGMGFLGWWFMRDGKPSNDKDYFTYCKDNPTIENYRFYVKKYPQGEFVSLAQNWIKNWEADSTANARGLDREPISREEPKPEVKPDEKGKNKDIEEEKEKDNGKDMSKDNKTSDGGETGEDTPKIGIEEAGNGMIEEEPGKGLDGTKPKTGLAPVSGNGTALTPSQSVQPKDENEAYMACLRPNATIETCLYWMERYGDAKTRDVGHWNNVIQVFTKKYKAIAKSCDTKKKCEDFLNAHDDIMLRARVKGTQIDRDCYQIVNDKLKELNNENYSSSSDYEEELYNEVATKIANNTATIEDCQKYLRKYYKTGPGSNAEHWGTIAGKFRVLYVKKIQSCQSLAEIEDILNRHDYLVRDLHLIGMSEYDDQMKKLAQTKKLQLEKNNAPRVIPGTNSPSAPTKSVGVVPIHK